MLKVFLNVLIILSANKRFVIVFKSILLAYFRYQYYEISINVNCSGWSVGWFPVMLLTSLSLFLFSCSGGEERREERGV